MSGDAKTRSSRRDARPRVAGPAPLAAPARALRHERAAALALAWALALALTWIAAGCFARPIAGLFPPEPGSPTKSVLVASHGWHTGLILRVADLEPGALPAARDFPGDS